MDEVFTKIGGRRFSKYVSKTVRRHFWMVPYYIFSQILTNAFSAQLHFVIFEIKLAQHDFELFDTIKSVGNGL